MFSSLRDVKVEIEAGLESDSMLSDGSFKRLPRGELASVRVRPGRIVGRNSAGHTMRPYVVTIAISGGRA
jgi:hypothetical protein